MYEESPPILYIIDPDRTDHNVLYYKDPGKKWEECKLTWSDNILLLMKFVRDMTEEEVFTEML